MGHFLSKSTAKQPTAAGSLQFQTSQQGGVIPLVYGTCRVAPNLIAYADFTAHQVKGGGKGKGGGGGKGGTTSYNYSASLIFGLCQGPVALLPNFWWDQWGPENLGGFAPTGQIFLGGDGQPGDSYWQQTHPEAFVAYSGTACVTADNQQLGPTSAVPNVSTEVLSLFADGISGWDCNPATMVADYLTNPRYGAGFPAANLDPAMTDQTNPASYWRYCQAAGIGLSPQLDVQQEAQQHLQTLTDLTNSAVVWSGGLLKILPYGDLPLVLQQTRFYMGAPGTVQPNTLYQMLFTNPALPGSPVLISYTSTNTGDDGWSVARDLAALINGSALLAAWGIRAAAGSSDFAVIELPPQGTAISSPTGNVPQSFGPTQFTFAPVTTVQYSLGEDDFIIQASSVGISPGVSPGGHALRLGGGPITGGFNDDPVHVVRSSPADAENYLALEFRDRGNAYNTTIAEVFDQGAVDRYGIRKNTSLKADAICNWATAIVVAQLAMQRRLYFRNTYSFKLGWKYCLLEPMDLVAISDPRLGLSNLTVRITGIEEDEEGTLSVTAEDFVPGWSTANFTPQGGGTYGFAPRFANAVAPLNPPVVFEPPAALTQGQPQLWVAVSGGADLGATQVFASTDGASYGPVGDTLAPAMMGVLTAALPSYAGANPDTADTLSVDLTMSRGSLQSVGPSDAQLLGVSLCYVDGELIAYTTATLTGRYKYALTGLYRGCFGSAIAAHAQGGQFALLDATTGRFPIPPTAIDQTLHLKFVGSNIIGTGTQDIAALPPQQTVQQPITGAGAKFEPLCAFTVGGALDANMFLGHFQVVSACRIDAGMAGCQASLKEAPASTPLTVNLLQNGAVIGTVVFAVGATTPTYTMATKTHLAAGDMIEPRVSGTPDSAARQFNLTIAVKGL